MQPALMVFLIFCGTIAAVASITAAMIFEERHDPFDGWGAVGCALVAAGAFFFAGTLVA